MKKYLKPRGQYDYPIMSSWLIMNNFCFKNPQSASNGGSSDTTTGNQSTSSQRAESPMEVPDTELPSKKKKF